MKCRKNTNRTRRNYNKIWWYEGVRKKSASRCGLLGGRRTCEHCKFSPAQYAMQWWTEKKEEAWIMDDLCDVRSYWAVHKAFMSWPRATLILVISLYLLFSYFCSCLFAFCSRLCPVWVCKFAGCWLCDEIEMTPCATVFLSLCKWLSKFI